MQVFIVAVSVEQSHPGGCCESAYLISHPRTIAVVIDKCMFKPFGIACPDDFPHRHVPQGQWLYRGL